MSQVKWKIVPPWIWLLQDGPYRDEHLTPMEWCPLQRGLTYERGLRVQVKDVAGFLRKLKEGDYHLYRILSHEPITEGSLLAPEECARIQLVLDDGEPYIDDYGCYVYCTTRLSPQYRDDLDLRSDNDDYTGEHIRTL